MNITSKLNVALNTLKTTVLNLITATAAIPNTAVPQLKRARIIEITSALSKADMGKVASEVDGAMVKLGGMDGQDGLGKGLYSESGWDIRIDQCRAQGMPVIGQFVLRAGYHLFRQRSLPFVQGQLPENNEVLIHLVNQLNQKPVDALLLLIWDTNAYNGAVGDAWQQATIANILDPLLVKRANGEIPNIPIIIQSNPAYFSYFNSQTMNYLYGKKDKIHSALTQWLYSPTPGPVLDSLKTLFDAYSPANSFTYGSRPFGFENNVVFHEFTAGRFSVPTDFWDGSGKNVPLTCMLFWDTKEVLDQFLNVTVPEPPPNPETPPVVDAEVEKRLLALEAQVKTLNVSLLDAHSRISSLSGKTSLLETFFTAALKHAKAFLAEIGQ